jgi:large subunit ribosomal protein L17
MRHRVKGRKLNRTQGHYRATMANLAGALIENKQIKTTTAKAKELRSYIEKLITHAKTDSVHKRRIVYRKLNKRHYVYELFHVIAPEYAERNGGYTRIIKLGKRRGDGAEMAVIQLIGFEAFAQKENKKTKNAASVKEGEPIVEVKETAKKKSTKKKAEPSAEVKAEEPVNETVKADEKAEAAEAAETAEEVKPETEASAEKEKTDDEKK